MSKLIARKLIENIYNIEAIFLFNCTSDELAKWWKKNFPEANELDIDSSCAGGVWKITPPEGERYIRVIWVAKQSDLDTLQHEVNHLAMSVFEDRGIPLDCGSQEPFCYYSEFWFKSLRALLRTNGKSSKA